MATALYRRYRPESFAEVIGQDHVTTPLRRALRAGRVGHAYLFSGPRGCGKTTSARILARCLNCAEGPTDTPCDRCDSCRDLARGGAGSLDVVEIDAASHGGVDDARELRERASFAPVRDRYKVFIIDEAHMVTSAGFNALLKLVEEPPDHVKFVFATTEPDKVIGTIRSRTHHYPFRLIPPQVLGPYLEEVCAAEGVQVGEGVMPLVVRAGGGSARDSMSVLDQLMAGAGEDGLDFPTAIALLGFTDTALLDTAITAVAQRDAAALYGAVEHVLATGHEPRRFVEDLLERMRDLIVLAAVPDRGADLLPQVPADELERMRGQAALFAPADLSQCGDLVHETLSTMSGATSPRLHLELLAARLVLRDERAALAGGADASAPASGRPAGGPAPRTGQAPTAQTAARGGSDQGPSGASGAREEARRIAQEKVEAARQARGVRPSAPSAAPQEQQEAPQQEAPQQGAPAQGAPQQSVPAPAAQQTRGEQAPTAWPADPQPATQPSAAAQPATAQDPQWQPAPSQPAAPAQPAPQAAAPVPDSQASAGRAPETAAAQAPAASPAPAGSTDGAASGGGLNADEVRGHWSAILEELREIKRPSHALIAQNAHVHGAQGSTLVLGFRTDGLLRAFERGGHAENVIAAVRRIMHVDVTVDAVVGEDPGPGGGGGGAPQGPAGGPQRPGSSAPDEGRGVQGPGGGGGHPGAGPVRPAGGGQEWPARQDAGPQSAGPQGGAPASLAPAQSSQRAPAAQSAPVAAVSAAAPAASAAPSPAAPAAAAPARTAVPWGGAAPSAGPGEKPAPGATDQEAEQPASLGQRASDRAMAAAARAAQSNRPGAPTDRIEDFPPEPDDPYPPDPEDFDVPPVARSEHRAASAPAPGGGAAFGGAAGEPPTSRTDARSSPAAPAVSSGLAASGSSAASASGAAPLEVEDEGRDSLAADEPRTFGQNALKRAIAEGRVVRSRPSAAAEAGQQAPPAGPGSAPTGPAAVPTGSVADSPASPPSPAAASWGTAASMPDGGGVAPTAGSPQTSGVPARVPSAHAPSTPVPSTAAPSSAAAPSAPSYSAEPPALGSDSAAPRSGAAMVREAAQASRAAGLRSKNSPSPTAGAAVPDADPTGGATRDDEDAVVATRNGREVIEKILGGKVLEVTDETGR